MSVYSGRLDDFAILAYPEKNATTLEFLQERFTRGAEQMGNILTDYGRQWYERAAETVELANNSAAMNYARSVKNRVARAFNRNEIRTLESVADLQHAPLAMRRFIMANPKARKRYHEQRLDGYSSTYVDQHSDLVGRWHGDYRLATNGVVNVTEDGWHMSLHIGDTLAKGERELHPDERMDIASAWHMLEAALDLPVDASDLSGIDDPTSDSGGKL